MMTRGQSQRWLPRLLLAALWLSGCRGCEAPPQQKLSGESRPSGIETIPEPEEKRFDALWDEAVEGRTVANAKTPPQGLAYGLPPGCQRQYQLRYLQLTSIAAGRLPAGSELLAELQVEADKKNAAQWRWSQTNTTVGSIVDGKLSKPRAGVSPAPARVTVRNNELFEVDGPYRLWTVFTNQPELGLTHPSLPTRPQIDTLHPWTQRYYPPLAAKNLIARRDARPRIKVANISPLTREVDLRLQQWLTIDGELAARFESVWQVEDVADAPLPRERLQRYRGRYVVSHSGVLLHAIVISRMRDWWSTRPGESNEKERLSEQELRLVKGCGGVELKPAKMGKRFGW